MDIELEYEDEREKEMNLEIGGLTIEIPEKLIQERMDKMYFDSMEKNIEEIILDGEALFQCLDKNNSCPLNEYNDRLIDYLESELETYR